MSCSKSKALIIKFLILKLVSAFLGHFGGGGGSVDVGGPSPYYAEGGHVQGPGTETSDSIHARLSHNEFVEPAKSVRHYGLAFMESIRTLAFPRNLAGLGSRLTGSIAESVAPRFAFASGGLAIPDRTSASGHQVNQYFDNHFHTPNPVAPAARQTIARDMYRAARKGAKQGGSNT
jgi:hypothetical protein